MTRRGIATSTVATVLAVFVLLATVWWTTRPTIFACGESPDRVRCASNLKQIGQAILIYGNEHGDAFVDSFATLLRTEDLVPSVFVCVHAKAATPARDAAAFAADAGPAHCDYVYLGDRMPAGVTTATAPANAIVALDREANHDYDGINLLFGDGHVEFLITGRRGRPAPWWTDVTSQIARGVRPVLLPPAATQPAS